jgi:hypothetical protein
LIVPLPFETVSRPPPYENEAFDRPTVTAPVPSANVKLPEIDRPSAVNEIPVPLSWTYAALFLPAGTSNEVETLPSSKVCCCSDPVVFSSTLRPPETETPVRLISTLPLSSPATPELRITIAPLMFVTLRKFSLPSPKLRLAFDTASSQPGVCDGAVPSSVCSNPNEPASVTPATVSDAFVAWTSNVGPAGTLSETIEPPTS